MRQDTPFPRTRNRVSRAVVQGGTVFANHARRLQGRVCEKKEPLGCHLAVLVMLPTAPGHAAILHVSGEWF